MAAAVLGTAAISVVASAAPGRNNTCDLFCHQVFGDTKVAGQCTSAAAHGGGPCLECGANPANYWNGGCTDILTDALNCGGCSNVCPLPTSGTGSATCSDGTCGISCSGSTPKLCGTSCIPASACCSNADCDSTHACLKGVCLARGGQRCLYGTDCFTQNCVSGICAGVCAGNPCDVNTDCTTGICGSDGLCQPNNGGGVCHCSGDCTTGNCVRNSTVYWGTCSKVRGGQPCAANADCTSGKCQGGICQANGTGGTCYYQEDCIAADYCRNASAGVNGTCYPR